MIIIFGLSLGLFICLSIFTILLGPKLTENSIKAFFDTKNYKINYIKTLPSNKKLSEKPVIKDQNIFGISDYRKIRDISENPPLIVPSKGIAARSDFLFTGALSLGKHEGIDIWTNLDGKGMDNDTYSKGNPVYAACSGVVKKVWIENGDISIYCDPLDEIYINRIPSLNIKTLYGHMADQFSNDNYILVKEEQKVKQGELIGYQGNRCFWSPRNRIVHLHFGIYDVNKYPQKPLDPTPYIGVSCTTLMQEFNVEL
jgi:murein DD-endopeptidase MepM/ murein hydrolase activator NlpD